MDCTVSSVLATVAGSGRTQAPAHRAVSATPCVRGSSFCISPTAPSLTDVIAGQVGTTSPGLAVVLPATPQSFGDLIRRDIPRWAVDLRAGNA